MTYKFLVLSAALTLVACGGGDASHSEIMADPQTPSQVNHEDMDHDSHAMTEKPAQSAGDTGMTTGVIRSIGDNGDFLTIDHGEIEGVGMGAMTMGFDIMSSVDLSEYEAGDRVAFAVKKGRDGSYRITAICETTGMDMSCLN